MCDQPGSCCAAAPGVLARTTYMLRASSTSMGVFAGQNRAREHLYNSIGLGGIPDNMADILSTLEKLSASDICAGLQTRGENVLLWIGDELQGIGRSATSVSHKWIRRPNGCRTQLASYIPHRAMLR